MTLKRGIQPFNQQIKQAELIGENKNNNGSIYQFNMQFR